MIKISIIIPVYNVEKYLRQCLESVINQTYTNIEIICINDCSTDSSLEILNEYAQKDNRIKIINNETNLTVGPSRNLGVEQATGEYIHYLDADDWMDTDCIEKLADIISKNPDTDMILHTYCEVANDSNEVTLKIFKNPDLNNTIKTPDDLELFINDWDGHIWNKLYSTDFLRRNNIKFNIDPCYQDKSYSIAVLVAAGKIYFYDDILLSYRTNRQESLVGNYYKYTDFVCQEYDEIVELTKNLDDKLKSLICYKELNDIYYILQNSYLNKKLSYDEFKNRVLAFDTDVIDKKYVPNKLFKQMNYIVKFSEWQFKCFFTLRKFFTFSGKRN
ncbi:glycosyltransferase family 2 protein [bacterium]|nr:glycosyltransferase family 2 protein [bacterium]